MHSTIDNKLHVFRHHLINSLHSVGKMKVSIKRHKYAVFLSTCLFVAIPEMSKITVVASLQITVCFKE